MLMNEMMKTRIMTSFLDTNDTIRGYLTVSSFKNAVKQILEDVGEEDLESSEEYFSLNVLSDEFTCDNKDWYTICDQLDCWSTIVQAMIKKGKLMYFIDSEDYLDLLVVMELLGTTVIFNCLDGIVGMLIHKASIDQFVKDANSSR
jgi:hypothetical protein